MAADRSSDTFADVVDGICSANEELLRGRRQRRGRHALPSRTAITEVVENLRAVLFPGHFGATDLAPASLRYYVGAQLDKLLVPLTDQLRRGLSLGCAHPEAESDGGCASCDRWAVEIVEAFVVQLPTIRKVLEADLRAAYANDPAAKFLDEALYCYPGILAITQHRLAHALHLLSVPLIPRIIAELAHGATGIDIHPGAHIGPSFFIDHGTGVVIGETSSIGARVRIYQGVTLGARGFPADAEGALLKGQPRHPVVEDDVVIYAGATILGRITIGRGAVIGGNVWLTQDVPPGARVVQGQMARDSPGGATQT